MLNTTARQNTTPRTVLVVEDEPTLATAIAQRITAEGWTARVAGDGASAVRDWDCRLRPGRLPDYHNTLALPTGGASGPVHHR